jgi:hypothetical protein
MRNLAPKIEQDRVKGKLIPAAKLRGRILGGTGFVVAKIRAIQCAGTNRHIVADERVVQESGSEPS